MSVLNVYSFAETLKPDVFTAGATLQGGTMKQFLKVLGRIFKAFVVAAVLVPALAAGAMASYTIVDLGTLGGTNSYGYSINIRGHVTGYSDIPGDSGQHAFLYRDGKMIDLNTLLPRSSKWTLLSGYGINDRGQITGYGLIKGQTHAFLMTPVRYR